VGSGCESTVSGGCSETNYLSPRRMSLLQQLPSSGGGRCIAPNPEVVADGAERSQETLSLIRRFEPSHHSFSLACGLV